LVEWLSRNPQASVRIGVMSAIAAYTIWGVFPLYWRMLSDVPALELVAHRVVWSTAFLVVAITALRLSESPLGLELAGRPRHRRGQAEGQPRRIWLSSFFAAVAISINWLSFVWAVNNGRVLESALGYYIAPLVSVGLGVVVMKERLSRWQWLAIIVAGLGVTCIAISNGAIPWVSIAMAVSFAIYGLLKKHVPASALGGLLMENIVLSGPAIIYLVCLSRADVGTMGRSGWVTDLLIIGGGIVTVPPLMLFAVAARRVSLSTVGVLQYIGPTLQFLLGVQVAGESLSTGRLFGFMLVWAGSVVYIVLAHLAFRRRRVGSPESDPIFATGRAIASESR
jgi:chloramphenicol-sensitive protein RarD